MNKTTNIVNGEWWELREAKYSTYTAYTLVNTHQREEVKTGSTDPTPVKEFSDKKEALYFLNEINNDLRNIILELTDGDEVTVELKAGRGSEHHSGKVSDNKDRLTIAGEGSDLTLLYSQIASIEK